MTGNGAFVEVDVAAGRVRGAWRGEPGAAGASAAFLGIPFAEAPVGELRFAAPVPKAPWAGVLDALEHGPTPQRGDPGITLIPEPSIPGDATLNLNVFTPSPDAGEESPALPVLVWIHGGGFVSGSAASPWYDGRAFTRDGVVVVTVSYRLGFDGFGWIEDAPSNRGVRDWLLALEWVRENIIAFGGDPDRVTLAGQSAGGGAVQTLLGMGAAQHLFHGAVSISGATADVTLERGETFGRALAAALGVEPTRVGFSTLSEERIHEAEKEATAMTPATLPSLLEHGLPLGPTIDGELILRPTDESLAAGVGADKPLVLGTTDDEFSMVFAQNARKMRMIPKSFLLRKLGMPKQTMKPYLAASAEVASRGTARIGGRFLTDRMFRTALLRTVSARQDGQRVAADAAQAAMDRGVSAAARSEAPTWVYRFSWPSGVFGFAQHCLDVPFFFDCLGSPIGMDALTGPNPPQELADDVHAAAVAFIAGGDPGWEQYTEPGRSTQIFDTPTSQVAYGYRSVRPLL
ncbi:carboxylesterase/lipase family protein [Brachybacterium sp. AOP3-A1-3]|uniref:carboxylesterase/lipase family protein n=1 Tax=Brachybacterium sp. AOP3-A1-3 TaxID=3457699 RepID=UPI004034B5A0